MCSVAMSSSLEEGGVMCFRPTMEQFRDFSSFVSFMEEQGAHKYGIAKVRPPALDKREGRYSALASLLMFCL